MAREVSDDALTKARGGVLGWRPAESLGYGKEVVEAAKKLEVGKVSEPIETRARVPHHPGRRAQRQGAHLRAEAARPGRQGGGRPLRAGSWPSATPRPALAQAKQKPLEELFERKAPPRRRCRSTRQQMEDLPPGDPGAAQGPRGPAGQAPKRALIVREGPNVLAQAGGQPAGQAATRQAGGHATRQAGATPPAKPAKPAATPPAKPAPLPPSRPRRPSRRRPTTVDQRRRRPAGRHGREAGAGVGRPGLALEGLPGRGRQVGGAADRPVRHHRGRQAGATRSTR